MADRRLPTIKTYLGPPLRRTHPIKKKKKTPKPAESQPRRDPKNLILRTEYDGSYKTVVVFEVPPQVIGEHLTVYYLSKENTRCHLR